MFKSVPGFIEGIPGHYGMFRGIMGCSRGVPGLLRAVPGCSGVFRGRSGDVPGCSEVFRGVPGLFRVLQTPNFLCRNLFSRLKALYEFYFTSL